MTRIRDNGTVVARRTRFQVSRVLAGQIAYLIEEKTAPLVFDQQGTLVIEHRWPKPGTQYVGSGRPRGPCKTL